MPCERAHYNLNGGQGQGHFKRQLAGLYNDGHFIGL